MIQDFPEKGDQNVADKGERKYESIAQEEVRGQIILDRNWQWSQRPESQTRREFHKKAL